MNTSRFQPFFSFLIISILFSSCHLGPGTKKGNGNITSEDYQIDDFNVLRIGGNYTLRLIAGEKNMVVVETDENLIPYINVEVQDKKLSINNVHKINSVRGVHINVFYKEVNKIFSMGASVIEHDGILRTDKLLIDLSGSGGINLEIDADELEVILSGAGIVKLSGKVNSQNLILSGAGALQASKLESETCRISLNGIGGAEIYVTNELEASVNGIGGIKYGGNPKLVTRNVSGLGKISQDDSFSKEVKN
ncbi:MAG: head GIN domain-containing protein [Cyclobacteriaceae bacterium]